MVQILYYILLAIDHSFIVKKDEDSVDIASEIFKHKHPPETKDLSCSGRRELHMVLSIHVQTWLYVLFGGSHSWKRDSDYMDENLNISVVIMS